MKSTLSAVILIGLSGTSLLAAPAVNLSALPAGTQLTGPSPADPYIADLLQLVGNYEKEAMGLIQENPYLNENPKAKIIMANLGLKYAQAKDSANKVKKDFGALNNTYNDLYNQSYPPKCKKYDSPTIQGIVKYTNTRQWALYNTDENKILHYFLDNVGQIGTGKEYIPSIAKNSLVKAQVGSDGKGKTVVVCMDLVK